MHSIIVRTCLIIHNFYACGIRMQAYVTLTYNSGYDSLRELIYKVNSKSILHTRMYMYMCACAM